jgi:hypothetical protein
MSVQDQITRITVARDSCATVITDKGVSVPTGTLLEDLPGYISKIEGGGGGVTPTPSAGAKDVTFIDYDGAILYSYTIAEAAALTELPPLPSHEGLICQGWNWNIDSIKKLGRAVTVGPKYITDDGKTRLYIRIADTARMLVPLKFSQTVSYGVTIDWGDGSTAESRSGTGNISTSHQYTAAGDFIITLTPKDTCTLGFYGTSNAFGVLGASGSNGRVYSHMLQKVEVGENVESLGNNAFYFCSSLASITIPDGVTSIGASAFYNCYSLASITIPDGVTSIGASAFQSCYSLASITIPDGVTSIGASAFYNCYSLASITIPDGVTSIGNNAFQSCYSLASITIPDGVTSISASVFYNCSSLASITIPDGVTSIGNNAFYYCSTLASITIPDGVTNIGTYAFQYCYSLASITIPDGVTSIGNNAFYFCSSLASITIPDGVTSISASVFYNCSSLASITIPDGVTSIGASAFYSCYSMAAYHLKPTTPPTLSNTNAFNNFPSDCIIYVPKGCLEAYQNATNWSTYAGRMQEEE